MVKVNLIGFDAFQKRIDKAAKGIANEVSLEISAAGELFVQRAKRAAPVDQGQLRGGISSLMVSKLTAEVVSAAAHSPYIEWGTVTHVKVPAELQDYSIQFKGKGIRQNGGIIPRPFFFPQIPFVRADLTGKIENILKGI